MRKIYPYHNEIFEIAKILKTKFPRKKIFIQRSGKIIVIKLPKDTDRFKIEELRLFLKTKYPQIEVNFQYSV